MKSGSSFEGTGSCSGLLKCWNAVLLILNFCGSGDMEQFALMMGPACILMNNEMSPLIGAVFSERQAMMKDFESNWPWDSSFLLGLSCK
jgi:hypothetical protein